MEKSKRDVRKVDLGSLLYIADTSGKVRPFICLGKFTNNAGIVYDWLIAPITSAKTVGDVNLVELEEEHPKLKKPSYVKLNNITTLPATKTNEVEIAEKAFTHEQIEMVIAKLRHLIKDIT